VFFQSISTYLGEDKIKEIVNFVLVYIAGLDIPIKRYVRASEMSCLFVTMCSCVLV
jgi:hypothetical protein